MSFAALAAVSKMHFGSAAEKLIALAYADRHNEETGCAYPSLAWLGEFSSLNRKTVIAVVARLEAIGLLSDSGNREGRTGQIKVYRVNLETVPKTEPTQKRNSSDFSRKESQKRDTDTVKEPVGSEAKASSPKHALPDWIGLEVWSDFKAMRKAMRNVPFKAGAEKRVIAKVEKLRSEGHDPEKLLDKAVERGWRTVFGDEDTKTERRAMSQAEQLDTLRRWLPRYREAGREADAEACQLRIAALEAELHPHAQPQIAAQVGGILRQTARSMEVRR